VAGGDFFQMDQTASTNQELLWNISKCCKNANLDCGIDLCFGCHNEKTVENRFDSLHNSTDLKHYFV
jgi:hypothetical protein